MNHPSFVETNLLIKRNCLKSIRVKVERERERDETITIVIIVFNFCYCLNFVLKISLIKY